MAPSLLHEVLVNLLRDRPELLVRLGALPAPKAAPRVVEASLNRLAPAELHADLALVVGEPAELALLVEVQLRPDPAKRFSWPSYAVAMAARWRCPATLLVVAPDERVARWAAAPIPFALDSGYFRPLVLGPSHIPLVTEPAQARADPELAVLSALAHGDEAGGLPVLLAMYPGLSHLPDELAAVYHDVVLGRLSAPRRRELEDAMPFFRGREYEYTSEFARKHYGEGLEKGRAEGLAEGEARMVLRQLVRQVGMLGSAAQARVRALPVESLEALGEALLGFSTPADLEAWLAAHGG